MATERHEAAREAVAGAARELAAAGSFVGTAGNVSMRIDDAIAISATGVELAVCTAEDVTVVGAGGEIVLGHLAPSSELTLHMSLYEAREAVAVVHTHAPFSTAVACTIDRLPVLHYQQLMLGGDVRVAPFAAFGTHELAGLVTEAIRDRQAALMANHGSVAVGKSLREAVDHAVLLEWLAALYVRASQVGSPRELTAADQEAVIMEAIQREYGKPQDVAPGALEEVRQ